MDETHENFGNDLFPTIYETEKRRRINSPRIDDKDVETLSISSKLEELDKLQQNTGSDWSSKKCFVKLKQKFFGFLERRRRNFRFPRKILFVLFISTSIYALITSQTEQKAFHETNPYHGVTPTYDKTETKIKSQSVVKPQEQKYGNKSYKADIDITREPFIPLPTSLQNIADVSDFPVKKTDIPFYFHIPRGAGSTVKDTMGSCLGLVGASDVGSRKEYSSDSGKLEIITSKEGSKFVNVDTTTLAGIDHAKELGLVESNLAEYVVTQYVHSAAELFTESHQARMFTIMRDPIERAVSLFHYLSIADWEPTYSPSLATMSIEMWARSNDRIEYNWVTRFLSNNLKGDLTQNDLDVAKEILRKKCLIGFLEAKEESMMRLQKYFNWEMKDYKTRECAERILDWGWSNKHSHPQVDYDSPTYELLVKNNIYDLELYEYAKELFQAQSKLFQ